ncbi:carboxymuconolactone decarboxylase family protein [Rhizobium sp. KVB221]|uniref:Carboxymuconolactone decarboxylase family protein n=1 Tax=Rhizobium setariae TaxID=2801340 RepID=A0A936YUD4_9HYPH|nr:carboxymuconolactone decarboxylase family protein [Rhizobium setariae]MBL0373092.1 carboxymuconolactone decarboxylase family protein [Rhizobium setariae]
MKTRFSRRFAFASALLASALVPTIALAADAPTPDDPADAAYGEMQQMFGGVPSFTKAFPRAGIAGAWAELRDLQFSDKTALDAKTKALISLAVSAQIPCTYCIYADTMSAKKAGATEQEIQEAVAMAAITRHWSTVLNGMQVDFETFKKEMSREMGTSK